MTQRPAPLPVGDESYELPGPAEASELLRAFAEPLLSADPHGPSDLDTIRTSMMLAMICWNLPVYEALGHPLYAQGQRTLATVSKNVPLHVAVKLRKLLQDRSLNYAAYPFLVLIEVTGTTCENARISAQARRPPPAKPPRKGEAV